MSLRAVIFAALQSLLRKLLDPSQGQVSDPEIALIGTVDANDFGRSLATQTRRLVDEVTRLPDAVKSRVEATLTESAIMNYGCAERGKTPRPWYGWVEAAMGAFVVQAAAPAVQRERECRSADYANAAIKVMDAFGPFMREPAQSGVEAGWKLAASHAPARRGSSEPDRWLVNLVRALLIQSSARADWEPVQAAVARNPGLLQVMRTQASAFQQQCYALVYACLRVLCV